MACRCIPQLATAIGAPAPKGPIASADTIVIATNSQLFGIIDLKHSDRFVNILLLPCAKLAETVVAATLHRAIFFHHATVSIPAADRPGRFDPLDSNR